MSTHEFDWPNGVIDDKGLRSEIAVIDKSAQIVINAQNKKILITTNTNVTQQQFLTVINSHQKINYELENAKLQRRREVNALRPVKFFSDIHYEVDENTTHVIDCDEESYENIKEALIKANSTIVRQLGSPTYPDFVTNWILKDNSVVVLVALDWFKIENILALRKNNVWHIARQVKNQINALTTIEEVLNFDIATSWNAIEAAMNA